MTALPPGEFMSEELADIKTIHNGNRFYKVDLHVHTPESKDTNWGDINAFQFLELFVDKGIQLIAVTDHSSGHWVDKLRKAARVLRRNNKRDIHVIPGVEIIRIGDSSCYSVSRRHAFGQNPAFFVQDKHRTGTSRRSGRHHHTVHRGCLPHGPWPRI